MDFEDLVRQFKKTLEDTKTKKPHDSIPSLSTSEAAETSTPKAGGDRQPEHHSLTNIRKAPVYKWQIGFSGAKGTMGVNEFLERVKELSAARGVDNQELFCSAVELLERKALVWIRWARTLEDWSDLQGKILEEYLPIDYMDKLWETINRGHKENQNPWDYI